MQETMLHPEVYKLQNKIAFFLTIQNIYNTNSTRSDFSISSFSGVDDRYLRLSVEVSAEPDSPSNTRQALDLLYERLDTTRARQRLTQYLVEETDVDLSVCRISRGSLFIDVKITDYSQLEEIKYLSDQGVLSNMLNYYLITEDFKQTCQAETVKLQVTVDIVSFQALTAFARGQKNRSFMHFSI